MEQTLNSLLRKRADGLANKTCVTTPDGNVKLSYSDLHIAADSFAGALHNRGCQAGDIVLLGLCNTPSFFVALFACFKGGFVAAPVDASLAKSELEIIADHAQPTIVVTDMKSKAVFNDLALACPAINIESDRESAVIEDTVSSDHSADCARGLTPDSPALLLYTSGTTGNPKGVLYTHAHLLHKMQAITDYYRFDESFKTLCLLPTHFGHGLICNCLPVIYYGGTLLITPPFNLDLIGELWGLVETHQVNNFSSVPAVLRLLIQIGGQSQPLTKPSLKFITCASAPLWSDEIERIESSLGVPILNCYGLTEAAGWIACSENNPDRNLASVGNAIGGDIRAVGTNGQVLKAGEIGEIQVKGPSVMSGYYKYDGSQDQITEDGWLFTGDLGEVDASGAVILHSRIKEIIIRAGKNIFPAEIDKILMTHPDVADACALGLDDPLMGEKVVACVVLKEHAEIDEQALLSHTQKSLAAFKCPQQILFVPSILKTSRGKVNRSKLKSLFTS